MAQVQMRMGEHPCAQPDLFAERHCPRFREVCAEDALTPVNVRHLFRNYSVEDMIGEGRFGTVWRCVNRATGAELACKQVDVQGSNSKALVREMECFVTVQAHPHVLRLERLFEGEQRFYLLTELCNGGDLFDYIGRHGTLGESEALELFRQLADGVHHCHCRGVIHRDVKPENVLLHACPVTGQLTVKLADFGLSKRLAPGETTMGWVGSEPYEAPEVLALKPYDFSADVFSLGVVLFGMLSGTWPTFLEGRVFDAAADFAWPGWQAISGRTRSLIERMLSVDPGMRPSTTEILQELLASAQPVNENSPVSLQESSTECQLASEVSFSLVCGKQVLEDQGLGAEGSPKVMCCLACDELPSGCNEDATLGEGDVWGPRRRPQLTPLVTSWQPMSLSRTLSFSEQPLPSPPYSESDARDWWLDYSATAALEEHQVE